MTTETQPPPSPAEAKHRADEDALSPPRHVYEPHSVGLPPIGPYLRELWRRREFAYELSRTTLRAQHFNTFFGQLWLVLNPLMLAGVYFVLVDILRSGSRGADFFAHLMACLFAYYMVQQSLQKGVRSVTSGGRLILNSAFPRILLPLSSVVTAWKRFLPTVLVYVPVHLLFDLPIGWHLLWVIPIAGLVVGLAAGMTMIVAALHVYFRDLSNFLPYLLRVWLYSSPILYYAREVPDRYDVILAINPLAAILTAWSDVLNRGQAPDPTDLAMGFAWVAAVIVIGGLAFMSREREFAVRL